MTSNSIGSQNTAFLHSPHIVNAIRIQWRTFLLAVIAISTVMFYWFFYYLQVSKLEHLKTNANYINTWVNCILGGGTQNSCAKTISPFLPSYPLMILAETLVSMVGLWLFIIFARRSLWHEWEDFL